MVSGRLWTCSVVLERGWCIRRRRGRWSPAAERRCRAPARRPASRPRTAAGTPRRRARPGSGAGRSARRRRSVLGTGSVALAGQRHGQGLDSAFGDPPHRSRRASSGRGGFERPRSVLGERGDGGLAAVSRADSARRSWPGRRRRAGRPLVRRRSAHMHGPGDRARGGDEAAGSHSVSRPSATSASR